MEHAKAIKVNAGTEPDADIGPVISKQVMHSSKPLTNLAALNCGGSGYNQSGMIQ